MFSVKDSGIGMNEAQISKLFQAFSQADASTTRKYGGTGLGLAISRKFCQMMGGDIEVQSAPGQGSTFSVHLPADVVDPKKVTLQVEEDSSTIVEGSSVLVIDDDPSVRDVMKRSLTREGVSVMTASTGAEGLELARKHRPDLILMDIQLPEVSGLEVTKWLKEVDELHVIPVIAVTAFAMKGDEERIRQGGCEAYVSKPISVPKFIETIKTYLGDA